jgi:predicted nucleic-acid-binding protein
MIGIDTNVLLHAVTNDDQGPAAVARRIMQAFGDTLKGAVCPVVLAELGWSLKTAYGMSRLDVVTVVESLLGSPNLTILEREAVQMATRAARQDNLDFPDALIASLHVAAGCETTVTFDQRASQSSLFVHASVLEN